MKPALTVNPRGAPICWLGLFRRIIASFLLVLAPVQSIAAADPYSAALDQHFSTTPGQAQASDLRQAALEEGIRQKAREMAAAGEPGRAAEANSFERFFVWSIGAVAILVFGLVALIALRRWNGWLDTKAAKREQARDALAEEPLMAEFLRTLHEDLQNGPLIAPMAQMPSPDAEVTQLPRKERHPQDGPLTVTERLKLLRADLQRLTRAADDDDAGRLQILRELLQGVDLITRSSDSPQLHSSKLLASALHCLFEQLSLRVARLTPSALRTAAAALDLLEFLSGRAPRPDLATNPPVRLLAVDDDPISLRAVAFSLKKAFHGSDVAVDGPSALALATQQPYDVIFLDIEMPGMDGFELCSKIHETAANRTTPVVFVTTHTDFDSRAKSALLGAQDFIAKPFLTFEITVKALTLVLRAREERETRCAAGGHANTVETHPVAQNEGQDGTLAMGLSAHHAALPVM